MIVPWMIYAMMVSALFAVVATLVERLLRANGKATRFIWLGAILGSLLFNAAAIWRARSSPDSARPSFAQIAARTTSGDLGSGTAGPELQRSETPFTLPDAARESWIGRMAGTITSTADRGWLALRDSAVLRSLDGAMLFLWGAASGITIALLAGSTVRLRRRRTQWRRSSVGGVPILVTDGIGPAVVGVVESEIVVPDWIFKLDPAQQQLIVEHERQHLLARDPAAILTALLAAAIVPWNAAMWVMVRRLRRSTEMDCDQRVLAALPTPREYAALLVGIGSHSLPQASFGHALADPTSDLERRVYDILNGRKRITGAVAGFYVAISAALIIAACATPAPRVDVESPGEPVARPATVATPVTSDSVTRPQPPTAPVSVVAVGDSATRAAPARSTPGATAATAPPPTAIPATVPPLRRVPVADSAMAAAQRTPVPVTTPRPAAVPPAMGTTVAPAGSVPPRVAGAPAGASTPPAASPTTVVGARPMVAAGAIGTPIPSAARPGVAAGATGGRAGVAGTAPGGRGAGSPPPGQAQGGRAGSPPSPITLRGTMAAPGATGWTPSNGSFRRDGVVMNNRVPSLDSIAVLAARKYPQLFTDSAKTEELTIVFALDTLGQVLATASLPIPLQPSIATLPRSEQIFLDFTNQQIQYGEWRSGQISVRGYPTKTMSLLYLVFGPK